MPSERPRINLTPDLDLFRDLEDWAEQQKRPVASLAVYLLSKYVEQAKQSGEYVPRSKQKPQEQARINILDLQKLADQLGMSSDQILEAVKEINLDVVGRE